MSDLKTKLKYAAETARDVAAGVLSGEDTLAPQDVVEKRLETCRGCEFFVASVGGTPRCNECGCFAKLKTHLKAAKCPKAKW